MKSLSYQLLRVHCHKTKKKKKKSSKYVLFLTYGLGTLDSKCSITCPRSQALNGDPDI